METRSEGRRTLYGVTDRGVGTLLDKAKQFLERNEAQIATCRRIKPEGSN